MRAAPFRSSEEEANAIEQRIAQWRWRLGKFITTHPAKTETGEVFCGRRIIHHDMHRSEIAKLSLLIAEAQKALAKLRSYSQVNQGQRACAILDAPAHTPNPNHRAPACRTSHRARATA